MPIIVTTNGKNAKRLESMPVEQEDYLQRYIADNPNALPLDEIKENPKLLVLGREFPTTSGPIDVLAIDQDGEVYVIETKLYKNPDKRQVVAQMLDYGAALWSEHGTGESFLALIDQELSRGKAPPLGDQLVRQYELDEERISSVRDTIRHNLSEGNIRFIVLMDKLQDRLKDLILFINQKSRFNMYAVEMEFYRHDGMEIVIPRLFGSEVRKDVPGSSSGRTKLASSQAFFDGLSNPAAKPIFERLIRFAESLGLTVGLGKRSLSLKLQLAERPGIMTIFVLDQLGTSYIGWSVQGLKGFGLDPQLGRDYAKEVASLVPGITVVHKTGDTLSRELTASELIANADAFEGCVKRFVQKIRQAASQK